MSTKNRKIKCGSCFAVDVGIWLENEVYFCVHCNELNDCCENVRAGVEKDDKVLKNEALNNLTVQEWANFNYQEYTAYILAYLNTYNFDDLRATSKEELEQGYLSDRKILILKKGLKKAIELNWTMKELISLIENDVRPGDLKVLIGREVDVDGNIIKEGYERIIPETYRSEMIARTEITTAVNNGAILQYKDLGVEKLKFSATLSDRTCDICMGLDNKIFSIDEGMSFIPRETHVMCRCEMLPVILKENE
jgi:SPP1 gp7 family putative phage head morphogenesis protein